MRTISSEKCDFKLCYRFNNMFMKFDIRHIERYDIDWPNQYFSFFDCKKCYCVPTSDDKESNFYGNHRMYFFCGCIKFEL